MGEAGRLRWRTGGTGWRVAELAQTDANGYCAVGRNLIQHCVRQCSYTFISLLHSGHLPFWR